MVTSGMPGSAVICVLVTVVSRRYGWVVRLGGLCILGLQRREQLVEPLMALVPEPLIAGQPCGHVTEWLSLKVAEPGRRPPGPRDQARVLQHLQVLRDRGL